MVVALGFFALAMAYSARAVLGLAMPVWEEELHWSRSYISNVAAGSITSTAGKRVLEAPRGGDDDCGGSTGRPCSGGGTKACPNRSNAKAKAKGKRYTTGKLAITMKSILLC